MIFISYSSKDYSVCKKIFAYLKNNLFEPWATPFSSSKSSPYAAEIVNAIECCDKFILLGSKHSYQSPDVINELDIATKEHKEIIHIKIDKSELKGSVKYYLSKIPFTDATEGPIEDHLSFVLFGTTTPSPREFPWKKVILIFLLAIALTISLIFIITMRSEKIIVDADINQELSACDTIIISPAKNKIIKVTVDIIIPVGSHLKIEPGVVLKFSPGVGIICYGSLSAKGSNIDSIQLTAIDTIAGWKGILLPGGNANFEYCIFSYGKGSKILTDYVNKMGIAQSSWLLAIQDNRTKGGILSILGHNNKVNIRNSKFYNNQADLGAAILSFYTYQLYINDCSFIANKTTGWHGGAIIVSESNLIVNNSDFISNSAVGKYASGGAVFIYDNDSSRLTTYEFTQCKFLKNNAFYGGSLYSFDIASGEKPYDKKSHLVLKGSEFTGNKSENGGAIFVDEGLETRIYNCKMSDNISNGLGNNISLYSKYDKNKAILYIDSKSEIEDSSIWRNLHTILDAPKRLVNSCIVDSLTMP